MNLNGFGYTRGWKKASLSSNSVPEKGFSYTKTFWIGYYFLCTNSSFNRLSGTLIILCFVAACREQTKNKNDIGQCFFSASYY